MQLIASAGTPHGMALPSTWNLFGDEHIPHRLLLLARMIDRETSRQLQEKFGLSVAEWRVLAFICAAGPASASHIGSAGQIDRAEISRAVRKLAAAGLIAREDDESHRRRRIIHPTAAGRRLFGQIRELRRRYFQTLMDGIPADDRHRLDAMLEKIAQQLAMPPQPE